MRGMSYYPAPRVLVPPRPQFCCGCLRCFEATQARVDAAKTHSTKVCIWPPNQQQVHPRPNIRVVLVPEDDNGGYFNDEVFSSQFYDEAQIEDITYDDNIDNKESSNYSRVLPLDNPVKIQALPVRKVQTMSAKVNGLVTCLTLDSGAE